MRVCHFTSAHETTDDRIFIKECQSLQRSGYNVFIVGEGEDNEIEGVHIKGCGYVKGRLKRFMLFSKKVYQTAASLDCDIYHFHDPELLSYGLKLKKKGKKVIFDSHEDIPAQILDKEWIPQILRNIISKLYYSYETHVVKYLDAVVTATPHIAEQFYKRANKVVIINNFPKLDDIKYHDTSFSKREAIVCYAGGIDDLRGENVMIEAMKNIDGTLMLAGAHDKMEIPGRGNIQYLGKLDREGINRLYEKSVVGLCILKPIRNYYYSQPIKIYEYMAAGIPFICSNFPLLMQLAKESEAGICIDPSDSYSLAKSINDLLSDRSKAEQMGRNGYRYISHHCTWSIEEKKLVELYNSIICNRV